MSDIDLEKEIKDYINSVSITIIRTTFQIIGDVSEFILKSKEILYYLLY